MDAVNRALLILGVGGVAEALAVAAVRTPWLAALVAVLAVVARFRHRPRGGDVHGTARWCTTDDARKAGLL